MDRVDDDLVAVGAVAAQGGAVVGGVGAGPHGGDRRHEGEEVVGGEGGGEGAVGLGGADAATFSLVASSA